MGNTYGTWLPGDRRGFRTEGHKLHVPYDYRNPPPPGKYDALHRRSKALMSRPPVYLETREQRQRALDEMVASLLRRQVPVAVASVDRVHLHLLVRAADRNPRKWLGIAKKESSHFCKLSGHGPAGGISADGCECKPITCEGHWNNTLRYIRGHFERGAVVYLCPSIAQLGDPLINFNPDDLLVD